MEDSANLHTLTTPFPAVSPPALQVAAVLEYTVSHRVATFTEPTLELCAALLAAYAPPPAGRPGPFGAEAAQGALLMLEILISISGGAEFP